MTQKALPVSEEVYTAVEDYRKANSPDPENPLTLKAAADQILFAKLAAVMEKDGTLQAADETLSVFNLAAKYVKHLKTLDALIKSATYKGKIAYIDYLNARKKKLESSNKIVEEVKVYCCPVCREQFANAADVTGHFNAEHDEQRASNPIKNMCPFCLTETTFDSKSDLANHIRGYHREKPNIDPPKSPIPPMEVKTVVREVEVIKRLCLCGHTSKDATEQGTHLLKCRVMAQVVRQ